MTVRPGDIDKVLSFDVKWPLRCDVCGGPDVTKIEVETYKVNPNHPFGGSKINFYCTDCYYNPKKLEGEKDTLVSKAQ